MTTALLVGRNGKRLTAPALRARCGKARLAASVAVPDLGKRSNTYDFMTCARRQPITPLMDEPGKL